MVIHFCDTNILFGFAFEKDKFHDYCSKLFLTTEYNPIFSERSLEETSTKLRHTKRLVPQIKNYIREPKLMKSQLEEIEIKSIESFLESRGIKETFMKTKFSDDDIFQMVRDYESDINFGIQEIRMRIKFKDLFKKYESLDINPAIYGALSVERLYKIIIDIIKTAEEGNETDCKILIDAIVGFKFYSKKQGFKKLFFISNDKHFNDKTSDLEKDIYDYFVSIKEPENFLEFSHIKDIIR